MPKQAIDNLNITSFQPLITPDELKRELPLAGQTLENVDSYRQTLRDILDRKDHRLFMVLGPCSIHDLDSAMEYARRLKRLSEQVADTLFLVMQIGRAHV